jgi:transposase-like protein
MNLIEVTVKFNTEDKCLDYIEAARWPNGVCCIKCGSLNVSSFRREAKDKNRRARLYECLEKECGYQFSTTTDTVFADTHLPLPKWFAAITLIGEAKKGISAKQVARHLGMEKSYKTVWYLCHRIRKAMKEGGLLSGVVETDETFMTPRKPRKGHPRPKNPNRDIVVGMIERGGKLRLVPAKEAKMRDIEPIVMRHIHPDSTLQTDKSLVYDIIGQRRFPCRHRMIDHIKSYAVGDNHTNSIENAFSLLKRGVYGTYHHVSIKHLGRYCEEFSFRFNRREAQSQMFDATLKGLLREKQLPFKTLTGPENAS